MRYLLFLLLTATAFAGELTDKAIESLKESTKKDSIDLARWKFFDGTDAKGNRASLLVPLHNETHRLKALLKYLEDRVKPVIPESDWLLLKERVERAAAFAQEGAPRTTGDTFGKAFRYSTDESKPFDKLYINFRNPTVSDAERAQRAELEAHRREAEGRAKAADKPRAKPRTGE